MTIVVDANGAKVEDTKLQCKTPFRLVNNNSKFAVDLRFEAAKAYPELTFMFVSPASLSIFFIFVGWPFLARHEPPAGEVFGERL